jgi:outer membrane receptor protein involved in Fe transport
VNIGKLATNGVDLDASLVIGTRWGSFSPRVAATRVGKYVTQDFVTSPVIERAGVVSPSGSVPDWKIAGSLTWERAGIHLTATGRYTSSFDDSTSANVRNGLHLKSMTLMDLQLSAGLEELLGERTKLARGLTVRFGASNLFDKGPSYSQVSTLGVDYSQADIRQRFIYLAVSRRL